MFRLLGFAALILVLLSPTSAWSKGGGRKGRGGGKGRSMSVRHPGNGGTELGVRRPSRSQTFSSANTTNLRTYATSRARGPGSPFKSREIVRSSTDEIGNRVLSGTPQEPNHAWNVQRWNEERKLSHRLQVAEHLRQNAERSGNSNLLDTADRMEAKAYEHYDNRMRRIVGDSHVPLIAEDGVLPGVEDELAGGSNLTDQPLGTVLQSAKQGLPVDQRLLNGQRKLEHQLDIAQKLRGLAESNGNENLIRTAERIEQRAVTRYENSVERWNFVDDESLIFNGGSPDPLTAQ